VLAQPVYFLGQADFGPAMPSRPVKNIVDFSCIFLSK